jgi:hypothetical protein
VAPLALAGVDERMWVLRRVSALIAAMLFMSVSTASLANEAACTNPAVVDMRPTGTGRVEIIVKNNSTKTSPKASLQLTYVNEDGKQTQGPALAIAALKPHASVTLSAPWPSSAETVHTTMACPSGSSH